MVRTQPKANCSGMSVRKSAGWLQSLPPALTATAAIALLALRRRGGRFLLHFARPHWRSVAFPLAALLLVIATLACGESTPELAAQPTVTPYPTQTPAPTYTPYPTSTLRPTNTPAPTPTPLPTDTPAPEPTPLPTDAPTPEPTSLPTDTPTPEPTPSPTTTPATSPCVAPDAALEPILDQAQSLGYDIGCPTAPAFSIDGALQEFWANVDEASPHLHYRSLMIWRPDNAEITVIDGRDTDASEGTLLAYTDTWVAGQPEVHPWCAGMTVPAGYELPVRGFGKVWCVNDLADPVGWPTLPETGVILLVQPTQAGLLLKVSGAIPTGYLVALDYRAVWGLTRMTTP